VYNVVPTNEVKKKIQENGVELEMTEVFGEKCIS
jgi:hypothetical protein